MDQAVPAHPDRKPFQFTGSAMEYFRIWIVNIFLSIITVGIYSAWAKVRTNRYFYGHTRVDGQSFAYLAQPIRILKGRLIAVVALGAYFLVWQFRPDLGLYALSILVLLLPAAIVLATAFNLRNSAWRNIRFVFRSDIAGFYRKLAVPLLAVLGVTWSLYLLFHGADWVVAMEVNEEAPMSLTQLMVLVFMLLVVPLVPYLDYLRVAFIADNSAFGNQRMEFAGNASSFYGIYSRASLLVVGAMVLLFITIVFVAGIAATVGGGEEPGAGFAAAVGVMSLLVFYLPLLYIAGFLRARRTNLIFNHLRLGDVRLHSSLRGRDLASIWITNGLAIILTLGLALPWASVRLARYRANRTELEAHDLGTVTAAADREHSAVGEEFGDMFGLDLGF